MGKAHACTAVQQRPCLTVESPDGYTYKMRQPDTSLSAIQKKAEASEVESLGTQLVGGGVCIFHIDRAQEPAMLCNPGLPLVISVAA